MNHILANLKAYAALVGAICTALLGTFAADTKVGQVLTVIAVIATAVGTWAVQNKPAEPQVVDWLDTDERGAGEATLILLVAILVTVLLIFFGVRLG